MIACLILTALGVACIVGGGIYADRAPIAEDRMNGALLILLGAALIVIPWIGCGLSAVLKHLWPR